MNLNCSYNYFFIPQISSYIYFNGSVFWQLDLWVVNSKCISEKSDHFEIKYNVAQ